MKLAHLENNGKRPVCPLFLIAENLKLTLPAVRDMMRQLRPCRSRAFFCAEVVFDVHLFL
jgi:hypothetical protein